MRNGLRIVDADAHVIEPHAMWTEHLDPQLRALAPRPVGLTFGFEYADGATINLPSQWDPDGSAAAVERISTRIQATYAELFPDAYAQGFSADAQLVDMDREGIDEAFLYPSFGLFVLARDDIDPVLATAIARVYNDWLAEFCATDSARLHGSGMVSLHDPETAAREAERCAVELGFRGIFVRPNPVGGRNFDDHAYDALWEVMSTHGMALGIHEGGFPLLPQVVHGRLTHPMQVHICTHPMEQMIAAVSIVYGGVLERFPGLRVAFLEAGCGWVPFWLHRMDEHWENSRDRDFGAANVLKEAPSEYFRRQCFVSADSSEYMLAQVIDLIGDDHIVFSTDYPHPDSPWPHAVEEFLQLPVSDASKRRILWDNAKALYGVA
ncbi:MAG TPA: amidohydrolase family protein [Acidimicrobiales bacterium]|jgi:predicted TIM-barrel fold metal-dependent hydrolase|nr:amidohydrolase family protein [Acidimicrobiales bacterium]